MSVSFIWGVSCRPRGPGIIGPPTTEARSGVCVSFFWGVVFYTTESNGSPLKMDGWEIFVFFGSDLWDTLRALTRKDNRKAPLALLAPLALCRKII